MEEAEVKINDAVKDLLDSLTDDEYDPRSVPAHVAHVHKAMARRSRTMCALVVNFIRSHPKLTYVAIAKKFQINSQTVSGYAKRAGIPRRRTGRF